jgi:hypothetical protein
VLKFTRNQENGKQIIMYTMKEHMPECKQWALGGDFINFYLFILPIVSKITCVIVIMTGEVILKYYLNILDMIR